MDTLSQTPAYDAFGDVAVGRSRIKGTRRARNMAVAVFWSIALMLIAGRVYQHDIGAASQARIEVASR